MSIWHKKTERPEKKSHCTRLIVTKFGSVFDEKEIDNGAFIETDWAYLDDLLECVKEEDEEPLGNNPETELKVKLEDIVLLAESTAKLAKDVYALHVEIVTRYRAYMEDLDTGRPDARRS